MPPEWLEYALLYWLLLSAELNSVDLGGQEMDYLL